MNALANATSQDTAFLVADYPYGFRLRCSIRYWIEHKPAHGFRIVSQTTDPKRGDRLNKPKAGTYHRIAAALRIDPDTGHVIAGGLSEYDGLKEYEAFRAQFPDLIPAARASLDYFTAIKTAHENAVREQGLSNYFDGNPEQRTAINRATVQAMAAHKEVA